MTNICIKTIVSAKASSKARSLNSSNKIVQHNSFSPIEFVIYGD